MRMTKTRADDLASNEQKNRFIETARQLECDEDKERFEEKFGKIARRRPLGEPRPKKRPKER
jgi:hypothetical protein